MSDDYATHNEAPPPIDLDHICQPDNRGHSTLAVYQHAQQDAVEWWGKHGEAELNNTEGSLEQLGYLSDAAMTYCLGQRIRHFVADAEAAQVVKHEEFKQQEWDGNPVKPVFNLGSFELDETLPFETQYPTFTYVFRWTQAIDVQLMDAVVKRHHANKSLITVPGQQPNKPIDPRDFFRNPLR